MYTKTTLEAKLWRPFKFWRQNNLFMLLLLLLLYYFFLKSDSSCILRVLFRLPETPVSSWQKIFSFMPFFYSFSFEKFFSSRKKVILKPSSSLLYPSFEWILRSILLLHQNFFRFSVFCPVFECVIYDSTENFPTDYSLSSWVFGLFWWFSINWVFYSLMKTLWFKEINLCQKRRQLLVGKRPKIVLGMPFVLIWCLLYEASIFLSSLYRLNAESEKLIFWLIFSGLTWCFLFLIPYVFSNFLCIESQFWIWVCIFWFRWWIQEKVEDFQYIEIESENFFST